jgi:hypothetical protein
MVHRTVLPLLVAHGLVHGVGAATPAELDFFEQRIRPVLAAECYECHGPLKQKGGLRLDSREAVRRGGESGPALVVGDRNSRLLRAIRHDSRDLAMPKDRPRLADSVIADLERWVEGGALDPRDGPATPSGDSAPDWDRTLRTRAEWWSFQPIRKPTLPDAANGSGHPVDRFIQTRLVERGLSPAPEAGRSALLRRLTFVLTGLPPSAEATAAFVADPSPDAYERVVDRLLDSPGFGERWARHWMDLVRYCESHGSQGDPELPMAWRYRDYLIRAFNADVPYDQFVREHIAGDLLPHPRLNPVEGLNESAIAPAHLRMVEHGYIPVDALDDQVKVVDNQIDVFSKTFLGLTVSCARCHDHKFDPISQRDFYALYGIFASCRPGQVVIDAPGAAQPQLAELAQLKARIRSGLQAAWAEAAQDLPAQLQAQAARSKARALLDESIRRNREELDAIESGARTEWVRRQGTVLPVGLPVPLGRWTFEGGLDDSAGSMHGRAEAGAVVRGGRLVLEGPEAYVATAPLSVELREKTLEAWVSLADLEQRGGGALTVQTPDSVVFDSIVFGEQKSGHWIAGSDFFKRTDDVGGSMETARPAELVHMAIVYRADNTLTLYRNGVPYGRSYSRGTLTTFAAGSARVVLGRRHLSPGVTALRGEIEEARLYARALDANEVLASFRAGVAAPDAAALETMMSSDQRARRQALKTEQKSLRLRQAALRAEQPVGDPWEPALADAVKNETSPLHAWVKLAGVPDDEFRKGWIELARRWKTEMTSRHEFNRTNFTTAWNLRGADQAKWAGPDDGQPMAAVRPGEFSIEATGDRVLSGLYPAGVFSHLLTRKQPGVYTSPRFRVETDSVSVRALGGHAMARLVVENYALGGGGLYPGRTLGQDEMGWLQLDTAYRKGATAYLELVTSEDFPNPGLRSGPRKYEDGRASFGLAEVVFHNGSQPPREPHVPIAFLLAQDPPESPARLAAEYGRLVSDLVGKWSEGALSDEEISFLNAFVRNDLLPISLERLPQLADVIAHYRRIEAAIPVPLRAPGVHDSGGFDQPLFLRGQPNKPGEPVPRRFLEVLHGRAYTTVRSGRLELAGEVASPNNPLTARVLVNRLWHHVFGVGLVGTTDNFGRLGDKPTHPELLDHLAARFIERGWSIKDTLRFLVTSHTFRQSTIASDAARRSDPANELLSHARVRRLEAEAIRDSVLAVSGQLDPRMYGPGVNVHYVGKTEGGGPVGPLDGDRRRSIYQRIRRNAHNPLLEAFDAPKPATTRGRRDATNVPGQALTLLNDPFILDQSARWARLVIARALPRDQRIHQMFARATGRPITPEEATAAREYLLAQASDHGVPVDRIDSDERPWQDLAQSFFCLKEFIYVD